MAYEGGNMVDLEQLSQAVISGDTDAAFALTRQALEDGVPAGEILDNGLIPGLRQVGDLFERGEYYLPELIVSGDAVSQGLELLEPMLGQGGESYKGKYLIGTVQGDVHDLGKNIVVMMLKGNGWEVTDLGVDISPEEFCSAVAEGDYQVLGMSSLLTMTMPVAAKTIEALQEAGLRDKVKVMVGGAPTTPEWAETIGADAHAKDGPTAARVAAALIGRS
jgi:5-methyltetrahydrofolate--homocysteine methyltransferase